MNGAAQAVAQARRWRRNKQGMCLYTVQTWLDAPWSGPWAEDAWNRWGGHHAGDTHPPPGVPVYWHNPRSKYGHIALSVGGGRVRSTDWPGATYVGETTIDRMTAAWNLRYLGWADTFSGGPIRGVTDHRPVPRPTPPPRDEDDMTPEQAKMLTDVHDVLFHGGPGTKRYWTVYQRLARVEEVLFLGNKQGTPKESTVYQMLRRLVDRG